MHGFFPAARVPSLGLETSTSSDRHTRAQHRGRSRGSNALRKRKPDLLFRNSRLKTSAFAHTGHVRTLPSRCCGVGLSEERVHTYMRARGWPLIFAWAAGLAGWFGCLHTAVHSLMTQLGCQSYAIGPQSTQHMDWAERCMQGIACGGERRGVQRLKPAPGPHTSKGWFKSQHLCFYSNILLTHSLSTAGGGSRTWGPLPTSWNPGQGFRVPSFGLGQP